MFKEIIGKLWKKTPRFIRLKIVRATQNTFTASAGALVTNSRKEILLLDHVLRPKSGWGIPGGFMNHGEQPEQTISREIMEEVGLELNNIKMLRVRTIGQASRNFVQCRSRRRTGSFEPRDKIRRMVCALTKFRRK